MDNVFTRAYAQQRELLEKQNYVLIKNFISKDVAAFIFNYGIIRHNRARFFIETNWPYYRLDDGTLSDNCVKNSYCCYSDPVMETVLALGLEAMQEITGRSLVPQYSYWRLYQGGDSLHRHKDRDNCEFAATVCFGYGAKAREKGWPIYVDGSGGTGQPGVAVNLEPGDMVVYKGYLVEHWREPFDGDYMAQAFLFYNDAQGPYGKEKYDGRPMLGLPFNFSSRNKKNDANEKK